MLKIKQLHLENFRGFSDTNIEFGEHITCIAGINGTGKTTTLGAIEKCMLIFLNKNHLARYSRTKYGLTSVDVHLLPGDSFLTKSLTASIDLELSINSKNSHIKQSICKQGASFRYLNSDYIGNDFEKAESCPVFAFYSINRRNTTASKVQKMSYENPIFTAWEYVNLINFDCFLDWFKNEKLYEYQEKEKNHSYESPQLKAVKSAISSFFGEDLQLNVRGSQLTANKNGLVILFSSLSDGEKSLCMLFADIARRLAIANPNLENPLEGNGVILVDEIEMHLHPSWQRKVCHALKETFPNCQFIITTHSPQVLGELKTNEIWLLNDFNVYRPDSSYGLTSNEILDEMMDVADGDFTLSRNSKIAKLLQELNRMMALEEFDKAKKIIEEIEEITGSELHETKSCKIALEMMGAEN